MLSGTYKVIGDFIVGEGELWILIGCENSQWSKPRSACGIFWKVFIKKV